MNESKSVREQEVDIFYIWNLFVRNKKILFAFTGVFFFLSVIYAFLSPEIYEAKAVLMAAGSADSGNNGLLRQYGGLASLAGVNLSDGAGSLTDEAVATMNSFSFQKKFLETEAVYDALAKGLDADLDKFTLQAAVKFFDSNVLTVSKDKKTGVYTVTMRWRDRNLVAKWTNRYVAHLNSEIREKNMRETRLSIGFLEEKINETDVVEMRATLFSLVESQTRNLMLANVRQEYAFKVIDPAYIPEKRVAPNRAFILCLGCLLGFVLASIWIVAQALIDLHARNSSLASDEF